MGRTKPTDYSKLVIYKIRCNDESVLDFYVGSTTHFRSRKSKHKTNVENGEKQKIYETIRANGGWSNWNMVEIEIYPCASSSEARIREEYWRVELQASLNQRRAYCSEEEYKAQIKSQAVKYYQDHVDEIKAKTSQKFECKCGSICSIGQKARHEKSLKHQNFLIKKIDFKSLERV